MLYKKRGVNLHMLKNSQTNNDEKIKSINKSLSNLRLIIMIHIIGHIICDMYKIFN